MATEILGAVNERVGLMYRHDQATDTPPNRSYSQPKPEEKRNLEMAVVRCGKAVIHWFKLELRTLS
jgi:hypothetical protein